jgi:O-antigen/teichoic acid export membrane protein
MGNIRKQTIVSSLLVYLGFGVGLLNTYMFVRANFLFTPDEYALTRLFLEAGQLFFGFASLGAIPVMYKFFPYYQDNLPENKNDIFTRTLIITLIGFVLVSIGAYVFQPLVLQKYGKRSPLFVHYYYNVFPMTFGILMYSVLEGYSLAIKKTILPNFLRETGLRLITTIAIAAYYFKLINFSAFTTVFSSLFIIIALILLAYLKGSGQLHFSFSVSKVTKKFRKKMLEMQGLMFGGICITNIGASIDGLIIASLQGLTQTAIYTFAQYGANLVQVPQRSIQAISTGVLIREWKNKNYPEIKRIYERSCINMLLLGLFIFGNIWVNTTEAIKVLNIQGVFNDGLNAMLVLGMIRIIDAGTGVNNIVILTSPRWRFDFFSGIIMLGLRIPLAYIFVHRYGFIGSAYAELISLTVYNYIRFEFIRRAYNMQPFTMKTVYSLLLGFGSYLAVHYGLGGIAGWGGIILRAGLFSGSMIAGIFYLRLTPDATQMFDNLKQRFAR